MFTSFLSSFFFIYVFFFIIYALRLFFLLFSFLFWFWIPSFFSSFFPFFLVLRSHFFCFLNWFFFFFLYTFFLFSLFFFLLGFPFIEESDCSKVLSSYFCCKVSWFTKVYNLHYFVSLEGVPMYKYPDSPPVSLFLRYPDSQYIYFFRGKHYGPRVCIIDLLPGFPDSFRSNFFHLRYASLFEVVLYELLGISLGSFSLYFVLFPLSSFLYSLDSALFIEFSGLLLRPLFDAAISFVFFPFFNN